MQIKDRIKHLLCRLGIYYPLSYARQLPAIIGWLRSGCPSPAPQAIKMGIVRSYLRRYGLELFIETGTCLGETLHYIALENVDCISVELSQELHARAKERFRGIRNVSLVQGDSAEVIPALLEGLTRPALFWLDGHYSGGITAKGAYHTPVIAEIKAVHEHSVGSHVILIDDARSFKGTDGYPHLDDLLRELREKGRYRAEVSTDIIRIVPE